MKTYPLTRDDGTIRAFEISNSFPWSLGPMFRVLKSVEGVTDVRKIWFKDDRFSFTFRERPCVVNEPWGDNSRYWIGPIEMEPAIDLRPVHDAFKKYRFLITFDREFRE